MTTPGIIAAETAPVLVLERRRDVSELEPLLRHLAAGGLFEPRLADSASALDQLPAGALVLASVDPELADGGADAAVQRFLDRGGSVLSLGDSLAALPALSGRIGWDPGPSTPLSEVMLRPRPGHAMTARLDPEIPLRDRLRLGGPPPSGATVLVDFPWHYRTQVAAFEIGVGAGTLLHAGVGSDPGALAQPVVHRLVHRGLRRLAGVAPTAPIRAGLLGYGAIGREHALSISAVEGLELRAVCDSAPARRQQAADEFEVSLHSDLESLVEEGEVDLVVVGTPPNTHADLVVSALEAGKHVVCEKPFALTAAECDRMIETAALRGRFLTVYQSRRWDPDFVAMRATVEAGAIGEPFYMESFIGGFSHPCSYWHSHEAVSGGTIYDWGSHYFDWMLQLFQQPLVAVTARQHKRVWHDVTNADQVAVELLFEGGAQAGFMQSDIAAALKPKWYLLGTEGAVIGEWRTTSVASRAWTGDLIEEPLAPAEASARVVIQRPGSDAGSGGREELSLRPRMVNGFYRNLADHLLSGERLTVTAAQARRTAAVMEAAARSLSEGGRPVDVRL